MTGPQHWVRGGIEREREREKQREKQREETEGREGKMQKESESDQLSELSPKSVLNSFIYIHL